MPLIGELRTWDAYTIWARFILIWGRNHITAQIFGIQSRRKFELQTFELTLAYTGNLPEMLSLETFNPCATLHPYTIIISSTLQYKHSQTLDHNLLVSNILICLRPLLWRLYTPLVRLRSTLMVLISGDLTVETSIPPIFLLMSTKTLWVCQSVSNCIVSRGNQRPETHFATSADPCAPHSFWWPRKLHAIALSIVTASSDLVDFAPSAHWIPRTSKFCSGRTWTQYNKMISFQTERRPLHTPSLLRYRNLPRVASHSIIAQKIPQQCNYARRLIRGIVFAH